MVYREATELGDNILNLGFIPSTHTQNIFKMADIFVGLSTWEEPFGLVFAEASASGLPVIASKRGGIPEIIKDGVTGSIIDDPSNIDDVAEKIIQMLNDPETMKKNGLEGRKFMEKHFSWQRVADEIENLYDKLLR